MEEETNNPCYADDITLKVENQEALVMKIKEHCVKIGTNIKYIKDQTNDNQP